MLLEIKQTFKQNREQFSEDFRLRIHRTLSWLEQAEHTTDIDTKFIFYWISFNAAYAQDLSSVQSADQGQFLQFIHRLCTLDQSKNIYQLVWQTYSGSIRILLNNKFTFQPFWQFHNGIITEQEWLRQFEANKQRANKALVGQDTPVILVAVFKHLYTLRNQIVHGGATHGSSINRAQVQDACNILGSIIPMMVKIMLDYPKDSEWGKPFYPVVKD
ncbi:hypothetical protein ACG92Y_02030 [Acinetobacter ursingii]|uniref:hypothetical protein n=1 Tax=Acinetobacter ursingii TaxID=108980 RepID=UPI003AF52844